jgi:hypothetical protein
MSRILGIVLAVAVSAVLAAPAFADPVAIANSSFEMPDLTSGGNTWTNTYPDWDAPATPGDAFVEFISGFAADGMQHIGVATNGEVSQNLGVQLLPNSIYQLTVAVGNRMNFVSATGNESTFGLYVGGDAAAGGTLVAESVVDAFPIPVGTFEDFTLTYTTGAAPPTGDLYIALSSGGGNRGHFDNIRLDASAIPEPSTLAMVLMAGIGVMCAVRRRRPQ